MSEPRFTQRTRCPGCGLWLLRNPSTKTVAHEAPECAWFMDLMDRAGGSREDGLDVIDVDTGDRPKPSPGEAS
jgi:hypothetical protein